MDGAHRRADAPSSDRRHAATSMLPSSSEYRRHWHAAAGKKPAQVRAGRRARRPSASPAADNSPICVHQRLANPHQQRIHHGECSPHLSQLLLHVLPRCWLSLHSLIASSCFASLPALSTLYDRLLLSFVCRWPSSGAERIAGHRQHRQGAGHCKHALIDRPNHHPSADPTINHRPTRPSTIDRPDHHPSTDPDHQTSTDPDHHPSANPIDRPRPSSIGRPDHQPSTGPTINHRPRTDHQPTEQNRSTHQIS